MPFPGRASKQHKRMLQQVFHQNAKASGRFLGTVSVHSIKVLPKFSVNPYYEPLVWLMIAISRVDNVIERISNHVYEQCKLIIFVNTSCVVSEYFINSSFVTTYSTILVENGS